MNINWDPLGHVAKTQQTPQLLHWSICTTVFAVIALGAIACSIFFPFAAAQGHWGLALLPRVLLLVIGAVATIFALISAIPQSRI